MPTRLISKKDADRLQLGAFATSNERSINNPIVRGVVETCQSQMDMTVLKPGSVWNSIPAHTYNRRMECDFYFQVPADQAACHIMGASEETRQIWVCNEQAVISPARSIHSGAGTINDTFM